MHGEQFRNQLTRLINETAQAWANAQSMKTPPNRRLSVGRHTARANALRQLKRYSPEAAVHGGNENGVVTAAALHRAANAAVRLAAARILQEREKQPGGLDNRSVAKAEAYRQARREVLKQIGREDQLTTDDQTGSKKH